MTSAATSNRASCVYGSIRRSLSWVVVATSALALGACGGGNGTTFGGNAGGDTATTAAASDLLIALSATSLSNAGSDAITVTVTAVTAQNQALANAPVTFSVDNNAVVVAAAAKTAATTGKITATVQTGSDRSNRIVTVTATSGSLSRAASFAVVGAKITASVLQAVIKPGDPGQIDYRLVDINSNPMTGMPINVSATGLPTINGVTDSNGSYAFKYVAPTATGQLDITATAGGVTSVQSVNVQAGAGSIPAVSAAITSASVTASPSVVSVNTGASNNRTEIRALFLGANNLPIPNVRVKFDKNGDANTVGGALSSADNIVYSDANGIATTSYIPGSRSSPTDGLSIRACYFNDDASAAVPNSCPNSAVTSLTVVSEPLAVSIGTNNLIADGADSLTYIKKYVVLVVDSSGQAKSGVQVTPSIDLTHFRTGFYVLSGTWTTDSSFGGFASNSCENEDTNRNGVLETGEDRNENKQLDPRKSDVAISMVNGNTTNSSGIVTLQIEYPKNVATWVDFQILVSAGGISGTEGRATYVGTLGAAASEFTAPSSPSFRVSPYGGEARECNVPPPVAPVP